MTSTSTVANCSGWTRECSPKNDMDETDGTPGEIEDTSAAWVQVEAAGPAQALPSPPRSALRHRVLECRPLEAVLRWSCRTTSGGSGQRGRTREEEGFRFSPSTQSGVESIANRFCMGAFGSTAQDFMEVPGVAVAVPLPGGATSLFFCTLDYVAEKPFLC